MRKWPKQHVNISVTLLFFLIGVGAVYVILVRPLAVKVSDDCSYISTAKGDLGRTGWPLDPARLESYVQLKKTELEGVKKEGTAKDPVGMRRKAQLVLSQCTAMLNGKIQKQFGSSVDFKNDVSRLDFQEEYNGLEQKLAGKGIFLSEEMLGLGEKTQSPNIYQMVLQVWMLEKVSALVMESGLSIQVDDKVMYQDEKGRRKPAAKIQFMPIIEYKLYEEDKAPYVIEFPMRIALYGSVENLCGFLRKLESGGNFFPVGQIQMSMVPEIRNDDTQLSLEARNMRVEIECSSFYNPVAGEPAGRKPPPPKLLPEGA